MSTPFFGKTFEFTQPDGSKLEVRGWGDQHYAVFETLDGYTVARNPATGFYELAEPSADRMSLQPIVDARALADGGRSRVGPGVRVAREAARAAGREGALRLGGRRCDERRRQKRERKRALRAMAAAGGPMLAPPERTTVGDYIGLCLLIDFSDEPATVSRDEVVRFCNQVGYSGFGNAGSVHDYFREQSIGRLRYTNIVAPYYRAKHPKTYYTDPAITMGQRARELIREALDHHQAQGFDFSPLTADGEGMVYAMNVYYAGPVVNNWNEGLWPHAWMMGTAVPLAPGKSAFDYQFTAMGSAPELGTFCHENGHMLCDYPDLYDYGGESAGVGYYCLMCAGNHADPKNPVSINAYLKRLSGWAKTVTPLEHGKTLTLEAGGNDMAMLAKNDDEYFLIENRQKTGRDAALPDAGLAVWHVDELGNNSNEAMTAASHYELSLEQADGLFELERFRQLQGNDTDLYAGAAARFADDTTPSSKWWDGTASHLSIDQVSASGAAMSLHCTFDNVATPPAGAIRRESTANKAIPDNNAAGITDTIQVADAVTIADIKAGVRIAHSYRGDIEVRLVSPWGTAIVLHPKGKGGDADNLIKTFDAVTTPALANWRGRAANGAWRIEVRDLAPADTGKLESWWLEFTPGVAVAGPVVLEESPGAAIPDAPAAGIERSLVTAAPGVIGSAVGAVTVEVDISHSYIGDLRVSLVSPAGTEVVLHDRAGAQADEIKTTYTSATTARLANLAGQPLAGTWRLRIADMEGADVGKLNRWKLSLSS
jgi:M6 family metalloprotease-like protein